MADAQDPGAPPPEQPTPPEQPAEPIASDPPAPAATPPPGQPAGAPPKKGMSTGAKVAIGCGIAVVLGIGLLVIAMVVGGMFLKDKAEKFAGGVEAQQEASEVMRDLERDHPFTAPEDGVVGEERAETFFGVTDQAWEEMEDVVEEWRERGERIDSRGGQASPGDVMAGIGALGDFGRSRVVLAEALEDHDMPVSEYVWTGLQLSRAYEALDASGDRGVPEANLELARENREALREIVEDREDGGTGKAIVLGLAWTWSGDAGVRALGWDTLRQGR